MAVCEAVGSWQSELQRIFDDLQAQVTSGEATVDALRSGIDQGAAATDELVSTLKGLRPPETEAGEEAQQELEALADQISQVVGEVKATVDGLGEAGVTEILGALAGVAGEIQGALGDVEATLASFEESADDELRQGFESAEACQQLAGVTTGG
jgi:ABC-type transporter Mla subunit MlaD